MTISTTTMNHHAAEAGVVPIIEIADWGNYITVEFTVENHSTTSFIYPAKGQTIDELIHAVWAALANPVMATVRRDAEGKLYSLPLA